MFSTLSKKKLIIIYSYILLCRYGLSLNPSNKNKIFFNWKKFLQHQLVASEIYIFAQRLNITLTFDSHGHQNWPF